MGVRDDFRLNARDLITQELIVYPEMWAKIIGSVLNRVSKLGL